MPEAQRGRLWFVIFISAIIIATAVYISLTNGAFDISVMDVVKTLLRLDPVHEHDLVIFDFRLPRIVIALLLGLGLGIAGAVIQGIARNPLADPGMLGINAGAGTAMVLFMLLFHGSITGTGWLSIMAMPLFGLVGGLTAVVLILWFAQERGQLDSQRLILVGIAIGSGFSAITLYLSLKMNPSDFEMATVWLTGSIYNANWRYISAMIPWLVLLIPLLWAKSRVLDVMQLQEASSMGLGVDVHRERKILLLGSVGLVSACVAVSGSIGFVGLIAPHIARRLVGLHHKRVIPISGLVGMAMVVVGDLIGKTVFAPAELPVGIVISIIGVPYFIFLLLKNRM
ncbi:iron ABC transporter permease [Paenibacillus taichungensis]|uniref:Iron ABC transporter permease n=1 Tax=Paenibacillus taichungensis TaxID=484184 RepID=A0A329QSB7_9BACL|nr:MULTISPECIES: iron ABC transporter permease [Paenibacillus]RAW15123.1 iron ABC transporter permease [Paenibacillus taichungensis]